MARTDKVIITCAVTGGTHTPTMSPYLPVTPDAIIGIDPNGQALVGIEPDEIDYFPGSDPLEGIEPDEIDVAVFLCASDCAPASQSWPAYAIADLSVDPTGATVLTPVQIVVDTNAF